MYCIMVAQAVSIMGQSVTGYVVTDEGDPLTGVEVISSESDATATTDSKGFFEMPARQFPLDLLFIDDRYHLHLLTVEFKESPPCRVVLSPLEVALSEVVIKQRRKVIYGVRRLRDVEGTAIYAGKKTEVVVLDNLVANLATNNARQIFAQVAGLNVYESTDAGLQLNIGGRGLDPNRTANFNTRQNGYDISADVLGYPESYYTPPAEALAEVQVIRGAASLQYGTQFGGLVNFRLREPPSDRLAAITSRQTVGSFGLFNSFNRVAGSHRRLSYQAHVQYKRGDGWRPNSGFESQHAFLQVGYQWSDKTHLQGEVTYLDYLAQQPGGLTDAQFLKDPTISNRRRNFFAVDWLLAQLKIEHRFTDQRRLSVSIFGLSAQRKALGFLTNRVSQVDDVSFSRDLIIGDFANVGSEVRYLSDYQLGGRSITSLVGGKVYLSNNRAQQGAGTKGTVADFTLVNGDHPTYPAQSDFTFPNRNVALFTEQVIRLSDRWSATPGLRFEYIKTGSQGSFRRIDFDLSGNPIRDRSFRDDRTVERSFVLGGLGLSYKPTKTTEWYGNVSQNYRSVTFNDIRIANPTFQVDPDIQDESGFTVDLGGRGQLFNMLRYDLGAYLLNYDDRIGEVLRREMTLDGDGQEVETGRVVRTRDNIGQAVIIGLETYVEWFVHRLWAPPDAPYSLALWTNAAWTTSEYVASQSPGVTGNRVEFVPNYNVKYGLKTGWRNLSMSLQHTMVGSQFTDASNAPLDPRDNQSGTIGAIPAYNVWDLSIAYRMGRWQLETGINNFLDNSYFTRRAAGYPGPGIIPSEPRAYYLTVGYQW